MNDCRTTDNCGACHTRTPAYRAYAHAQGQPCAEAQLLADSARWPGGCMTGFILWIAAAKRVAWRTAEPSVTRVGGGPLVVWEPARWHWWLRQPENWPGINTEAQLAAEAAQ